MKMGLNMLTVCGVILAMMTAGGMDDDSLSITRIVVQAVLSAGMIWGGSSGARLLENRNV